MFTSDEIQQVRADTLGCQHVIHFNNAGAGLMPRQVLETTVDFLNLEATIGGYEAKEARPAEYEQIYNSAAKLIHSQPSEIALVENATVAWQLAFASIRFKPGDRIVTANASYHSNYLNFLLAKERFGVEIDVVENDAEGQLSVEHLKTLMNDRVKLIAITHVPTNGGLVNPAEAVGQVARPDGSFYLLDACQSVGQLPVDVEVIGCDILSTTGRKWLRGPRGTGFLYVKQNRLDDLQPPFIDLHSADWVELDRYELMPNARRFENWESNFAAHLGLGASIDYALEIGIDRIWARVQKLGNELRSRLAALPGVNVYDLGPIKGGTVTWASDTKSAEEIKLALREQKINVSISGLSSTRLDGELRNLPTMIRSSIHYYNTEEEIERFIEAVSGLIAVGD